MTSKIICQFLLLLFMATLVRINTDAQSADMILTNGKIFTADTSKLFVEALAIKGNKIMATGTTNEILKLANNKTRKIDVKGKSVIPGINDQHDHPAFEYSAAPNTYEYHEINWEGPTKKTVLDSIAILKNNAKPGEWITGMIGTSVFFDSSIRRSLDSIAPNNPVALFLWWGHGLVTNKKGLETVGLSDESRDPVGGWYERNDQGKIFAVQQNAQVPFWWGVNDKYPIKVIKLMEAFAKEQLKGGITTTLFFASTLSYELINKVMKQANIPQRLRFVAWPRSTSDGRVLSEWPLSPTYPSALSVVSGIKYVIDGTPGEGNALRSKPYHNRGTGNGRLNYPPDTIRQILKEALTTRRQLMLHITADSSFSIVLKLIKETGPAAQWRPLRLRIEHNAVGYPREEQLKILKEYGILMMHTPKYAQGSPIKSLLDKGIIVGISPDGTINPFFDIFMMTTQQANTAENIKVEDAVIAYTKTNAYAEFKEKEKGTLMPGMFADLTVLSQDIFTIPPPQLLSTKSLLTIIDGKIVYEDKFGD